MDKLSNDKNLDWTRSIFLKQSKEKLEWEILFGGNTNSIREKNQLIFLSNLKHRIEMCLHKFKWAGIVF